MRKQEQSTGNDGSTLALQPMGRVNQSRKQRAPVAPQNGDFSSQKKKEIGSQIVGACARSAQSVFAYLVLCFKMLYKSLTFTSTQIYMLFCFIPISGFSYLLSLNIPLL